MERISSRRLIEHLVEKKKLDHRQHALRPGYGSGTYLASLSHILDDAQKNGEHFEMAALDLAKAYNRAWTPGVLGKLARWGITGNMLLFVKNFLAGRTFQVVVGNHKSKVVREEIGVPQGSALAITLFLVAMSSVFLALPMGIFISALHHHTTRTTDCSIQYIRQWKFPTEAISLCMQ